MKLMSSVALGVVSQTDDPQGEGRIKVKYHDLPGEVESAWVAIAAPLAGPDRGLWFMPEVGDEVLVAFDRGDFDHAYVIGYLWNGKEKPPDTENTNRTIKTPGGHTLVFSDKDGAKKIEIKTDGGHDVLLSDQDKKIEIKSSSGHTITMDDDGHSITISDSSGSNKVTIDGSGQTITVEATTKVTVQAAEIDLLQGATHPLVYGDVLVTFLSALMPMLQSHLHIGQTVMGIPVTPAPPTVVFPVVPPLLVSPQVKTG